MSVPATGAAAACNSVSRIGAADVPPVPKVTGPAMLRVPGLVPVTVPPVLTVTAPAMLPVPPSVPVLLTVTGPVPVDELGETELASTVPAPTTVPPVYWLLPARMSDPDPVLVRAVAPLLICKTFCERAGLEREGVDWRRPADGMRSPAPAAAQVKRAAVQRNGGRRRAAGVDDAGAGRERAAGDVQGGLGGAR